MALRFWAGIGLRAALLVAAALQVWTGSACVGYRGWRTGWATGEDNPVLFWSTIAACVLGGVAIPVLTFLNIP